MVDAPDKYSQTAYYDYGRVARRLMLECTKLPKLIAALCALTAFVFIIQAAMAVLIMYALGTHTAFNIPQIWSGVLDVFEVPLHTFWGIIIALLIARISANAAADWIRLKARRRIEISLSQSFIDYVSELPSNTACQTRTRLIESGPSVMTRGANMSAIVGSQMVHVLAKLPFILVYLTLLAVLFPRASLYGFVPLLLALISMIILTVKLRTLSKVYTQAMTAAVTERRTFWNILKAQSQTVSSPKLTMTTGKTGAQFDSFYVRHSRSIALSFIGAVMIMLAIAASLYGFTRSVNIGDALWPEVIILLAITQLLFSDIRHILNMFSGLSRNYEPIQKFLVPLMASERRPDNATDKIEQLQDEPREGESSKPEKTHTPQVVIPALPPHLYRVSLFSRARGNRAQKDDIQAVLDLWPLKTRHQLERNEYFPKPLPHDEDALIALGQGFPRDSLYVHAARHIRSRHITKWRLIFTHMKETPILNICRSVEDIFLMQTLGFDHVFICEAGRVIDGVDLSAPNPKARLAVLISEPRTDAEA